MVVRTTSHIFWKSLEVLGKLLEMCGSSWDVFRNSCHNRTKISCLINLTPKELASILYWHVCICIKDNHRRQEEPAILISRLLLYTHALHVCSHLFGLPQRKYGMHRTQFEHVHLDLISLVIPYHFDHHTKHSTGLKRKCFDIQSLLPTLHSLYY